MSFTRRGRALSRLPCWARDTSLLRSDVKEKVILRVKALNINEDMGTGWYTSTALLFSALDHITRKNALTDSISLRTSPWYGGNITTTERAEIILHTMVLQSLFSCSPKNIDEFVLTLSSIFWPDKIFDRRANIFVADGYANDQDPDQDNRDYKYCQHKAYYACAIQILAGVLDDIEKRNTRGSSLTQSMNSRILDGEPVIRPGRITNKSDIPCWVRYPECLDVYLSDKVVDLIKEVNASKCEPSWRLKITTEERAKILHARIQRRFNKTVRRAIERQRPMAALFHIFETRFAETLRSMLTQELRVRRDAHPSAWSQTCGIWHLVQNVLLRVLEDCERQRRTSKGGLEALHDRINGLVKYGTVLCSALTNPFKSKSNTSLRAKLFRYSV
ncbi:hypothetical protein F5B22DRAFT_660461 [Xylaria bambusicola]|uniref:uncharacterized protein n=1 Tax=Xylaria bambusicola TaxID=326684 RepID=UPI002008212D|nr:uncharacterized protein F5B22DRAFT_660461 [Xylaria bambusicola]KAI0522085.1 hypothetical protein F5B22DRAFT_660461 [Xylaria bambusicola]